MSDYSEFKRLADELMHAVHLSIEDERYLHSPKFGGLLDELMAENESLRKDAKRYRWMRDEAIDPGTVIDKKVGISEIGGFPIWEYRCGTELDDAIDAAISSPENH